ncbi:hypothetical protein [Actinorugispora endophytica]|uniref:Uncharacterized protein n=1 Tax=Actinorugispora endophytica TaxID=1605990 RepID=A0A4V3D8K8_9ACTN|nr:hypothetical protein [Actinorugispora endophytica]TDQ52196.1 hypothetical protein EV190_10726 [Actinorugispora endophytica]
MSSNGTFDSGGHSRGLTRRSLLERLAVGLRERGCRALIALSGTDHPVLYVTRDGGGMTAVVAVQTGSAWSFLWGRNGQAAADSVEAAARVLSGSDRGRRRGPAARRPQPRGALRVVA